MFETDFFCCFQNDFVVPRGNRLTVRRKKCFFHVIVSSY